MGGVPEDVHVVDVTVAVIRMRSERRGGAVGIRQATQRRSVEVVRARGEERSSPERERDAGDRKKRAGPK
jgi:hypothetical protein